MACARFEWVFSVTNRRRSTATPIEKYGPLKGIFRFHADCPCWAAHQYLPKTFVVFRTLVAFRHANKLLYLIEITNFHMEKVFADPL